MRNPKSPKSTPPRAVKPVAGVKPAPGKPGSYVKFSDKLTQSLDDIGRMIQDHKDMIDAIQEVALELTGAIGSLHTLTVKYAGKANQILDVLLPILKNVPIIPKNVMSLLVEMEKYTQNIIDTSVKTSRTITDVHGGLQTGDVSRLKVHAGELQNVTRTLTSILPKG
ncbi:MAG: hypothetical protein EPO32_02385 [Anaerolineae bacterium]|nr:MAG: hypothetical protein EPO32_02385 [Anaerolineae bacterium]